jgi:hypothetical protein
MASHDWRRVLSPAVTGSVFHSSLRKRRRRAKILPSADDLHKIGRYESFLSKEMYRALHELEALQERRSGGKSPLARLDVQLP